MVSNFFFNLQWTFWSKEHKVPRAQVPIEMFMFYSFIANRLKRSYDLFPFDTHS